MNKCRPACMFLACSISSDSVIHVCLMFELCTLAHVLLSGTPPSYFNACFRCATWIGGWLAYSKEACSFTRMGLAQLLEWGLLIYSNEACPFTRMRPAHLLE